MASVIPPTPKNASDSLPYWQLNLPVECRPSTCPDFLKETSQRNIDILSYPQELYKKLSWPEVKGLIRMIFPPSFQIILDSRYHVSKRTTQNPKNP